MWHDLLLALSPPSRTQIWAEWFAVALLLAAVGVLVLTYRPPEPSRPARKPDAPKPGRPPRAAE